MYHRAQNNDPEALEAYNELGYHIAQAIQIVMYTIDPEMIVLGGSVVTAHPYFEKSMWTHLQSFPYRKSLERIQIRFSRLTNPGILGAAGVALAEPL